MGRRTLDQVDRELTAAVNRRNAAEDKLALLLTDIDWLTAEIDRLLAQRGCMTRTEAVADA